MSQTFFHFKEFRVNQDISAMKVTTEACLFGAFVANHLSKNSSIEIGPSLKLLDIGAGTGLLSLLVAQKNPSLQIIALEIDEEAASQCQENFSHSPWKHRLFLIPLSLQKFQESNQKIETSKFDVILSNPPYHENQLQGKNLKKTKAHHSSLLSLEELFQASANLIQSEGQLWLLIPFYRLEETELLATRNHFSFHRKILIRNSAIHPIIRVILHFSKTPINGLCQRLEIHIRDSSGEYSKNFKELLQDYYL